MKPNPVELTIESFKANIKIQIVNFLLSAPNVEPLDLSEPIDGFFTSYYVEKSERRFHDLCGIPEMVSFVTRID